MGKIGIFYGSTEGNTEDVADKVKEALGDADVHNVDSATADDLAEYDTIIFGASTWEIGELQEDWETFIDVLDDVDFSGKKVSYIGLGDADGYPDTFVDAIGMIHEKIVDSGAEFFGAWPTDDYEFDESKGIVDGKFLGLVIDEDNESDKTGDRIAAWVAQIKGELGL
ncbi:MAG: flavodoxin [Cyclobacteriaceae bacterium]|nr:flavodoxin [Cyclobacteriaceae bacterium]